MTFGGTNGVRDQTYTGLAMDLGRGQVVARMIGGGGGSAIATSLGAGAPFGSGCECG